MHKIIIDTDPGIDDAQAIAFAIAHPDIQLLGLTTVFGNADIQTTSTNALSVLEHFGEPQIPVARGAAEPLTIKRFAAPDFVHGKDGMGNLNLPEPGGTEHDLNAAQFIVDAANQHLGQVTLVAIGPLSNVAAALMLDPDLPSKLKGLVVMGGTVSAPGNVSPVAEANFINDPHAADMVCANDWPLTVIGLDVTMQTPLTDSHFLRLKNDAGGIGDFLWRSSRFYVDFYSNLSDPLADEPACAMHDASAVVFVVRPDLFDLVSGPARVVTSDIALGQLILDQGSEPYLLPHWEGRAPIRAAVNVDSSGVLNTFVNTLIDYQSTINC